MNYFFVPKEIGIRSTYEALNGTGFREIGVIDIEVTLDMVNRVEVKIKNKLNQLLDFLY